jgi:hypothetical protein
MGKVLELGFVHLFIFIKALSFLQYKGLSHSSQYYVPLHSILILVYTGIYRWIHTEIYRDEVYFCVQDTIIVVSPYPYCIEEDRNDVPLGTVAMPVSSSSSPAISVQRMEDCQKTQTTKQAQMISRSSCFLQHL